MARRKPNPSPCNNPNNRFDEELEPLVNEAHETVEEHVPFTVEGRNREIHVDPDDVDRVPDENLDQLHAANQQIREANRRRYDYRNPKIKSLRQLYRKRLGEEESQE